MINYGYQGVDTASYRLLRFGEKLVQIWCSEDLEPGQNQSLVQWIQDRGLCTAEVEEVFVKYQILQISFHTEVEEVFLGVLFFNLSYIKYQILNTQDKGLCTAEVELGRSNFI